jgi:isocitrate/isopropylmalate dehydrogenase
MARHRIAWMPGDGIGRDVIEAARLALDALGLDYEAVPVDVGWDCWCREGDPLPARSIERLRELPVALFGAITSKPAAEAEAELASELRGRGLVYRSPIVRLRQEFQLAVNLRPAKAIPNNPLNARDDIDLVVFRENTEDLYAGLEYHPVPDNLRAVLSEHPRWAPFADVLADEVALSLRVTTRAGCTRILRAAFDHARRHARKRVTVVEKPNVLRETSGLMVRVARELAADYPELELREANVDAFAMELVRAPQEQDVVVSTNLFGDIVSDLAAQLVGGLGCAPSANLGADFALFEPIHGSAPDLAGTGRANPIGMLASTVMMLDHLEEATAARRLEVALTETVAAGTVRTPDMGGSHTTLEMAAEVARRIGELN